MKIALGTLQDEFELSGEFQAFRGWTEKARESGADIRLFSARGELRAFGFIKVKSGEFLLSKWFEQWGFIRRALEAAQGADLLHLFLPNPCFLWIADRVKKQTPLPMAVTCLGEKPAITASQLLSLLGQPQALRFHGARYLAAKLMPEGRFLCDRYVVGNHFLSRQLQEAGCPERKISVQTPSLPGEPPADEDSMELARQVALYPTFIYLGHFLPNKGIDVLLKAFAEVERNSARLLLAWSGLGSLEDVRRQLNGLGIAPRVSITQRPIHRSTVLAKARAVILPFRVSYGQVSPPLVLLEALRAGAAAIVSDFPAVADLGADAVLRVPAGDAGALAEKMRALVDHPRKPACAEKSGPDVKEFYNSLIHGQTPVL